MHQKFHHKIMIYQLTIFHLQEKQHQTTPEIYYLTQILPKQSEQVNSVESNSSVMIGFICLLVVHLGHIMFKIDSKNTLVKASPIIVDI